MYLNDIEANVTGLAPKVQQADAGKRARGAYYTLHNPFDHPAFEEWADAAALTDARVLEPFAGENSLIAHLRSMGLAKRFSAFDIAPAAERVRRRDTLSDFPKGYEVCITNPPWLAKNSATVRGLPYPDCRYDDVYKWSLELCLEHCRWVAALIPESFIRSGLFHHRLTDFISIRKRLFAETAHPVGLALFAPQERAGGKDFRVWSDMRSLGRWQALCRRWLMPPEKPRRPMVFNDPEGNLGFIAFDNVREASIRFCKVKEIVDYEIKQTSRFITRIRAPAAPPIPSLNTRLEEFRDRTGDIFLSAYRGLRHDGYYRRRMDWKVARAVVEHAR